jgi:hypothetical protein
MGEIGIDVVHEIGSIEVDVHQVARPPGQFGRKGRCRLEDEVSPTERIGSYSQRHRQKRMV